VNVIDGNALLLDLILWVSVAIALAVGFKYISRPRVRARYPGGELRYATALTVQAAAFMIPIPVVIILLIGTPIPKGVDVVLAIAAGLLCVVALRYAPVTGKLLGDLHLARVQEVNDRAGPRS